MHVTICVGLVEYCYYFLNLLSSYNGEHNGERCVCTLCVCEERRVLQIIKVQTLFLMGPNEEEEDKKDQSETRETRREGAPELLLAAP